DGQVVGLAYRPQNVPAEDRGGCLGGRAAAAGVGGDPGTGEGPGDDLADLLGRVALGEGEVLRRVVVDNPGHDPDVVVVQGDGRAEHGSGRVYQSSRFEAWAGPPDPGQPASRGTVRTVRRRCS